MTPTIQESELLRVRHDLALKLMKVTAIANQMHGATWHDCWHALREDKRFPDCTDTEITELVTKVYAKQK